MNRSTSHELFEKSKNLIPGGVNSPVRAFKSVGGSPVFMASAKGAYLYDVDGNAYLDLIGSWGPMLFGHAFEPVEKAIIDAVSQSTSFGAPGTRELTMAELIYELVPSIEMVRMVNSGTEACMAAIRVARGYTGKSKIIKFEGCYHGHGDSFLIAAGSGAVTNGEPDSLGVTQGVANDTLTAPYNDLKAVKTLIDANLNQIACIIVEPIVGNMGCVLPEKGFLEGLRTLCNQNNIVLIFDEVMTGFRLSAGGAQQWLGITPDITTLGKIIGGGMPVGAYGGKKEIMQSVSPLGKVYQAGTLSGNPVAMAAGIAMLSYIKSNPSIYNELEKNTAYLCNELLKVAKKEGVALTCNQAGSMYSIFFTDTPVINFETAKKSNLSSFGKYFHSMLNAGVYLAPSQFESLFISTALTKANFDFIIEASSNAFKKLHT